MPVRHIKIVIVVTLLLLLAVHAQGLVEPGRIVVTSTPSGALACIDTVYCDTTDATFSVTGNAWHSVVVTEKGYAQWSGTVFVVSSQSSLVDAEMQFNPFATVLQVDVSPGGGTVCIDNSECHTNVGTLTSPGSTRFTGVNGGYHAITVKSPPGYRNYYTPVYINLAKITDLNIKLNPLVPPATPGTPVYTITPVGTPVYTGTGLVRVYVDQINSTVCLDHADCRNNVGGTAGPATTGTTLFTNVTAGYMHSISVTADGYKPYSTNVLVGKDLIVTVNASLLPIAVDTTTPAPTPATY
jgi:PEGA domain